MELQDFTWIGFSSYLFMFNPIQCLVYQSAWTQVLQLIESISRKVTILDEERSALDEEISLNEALKAEVFNDLTNCGDAAILEKIEKNLAQNAQLCRWVLCPKILI